jgi:hypothetical protein
METETNAGRALGRLAAQLRRHYFHLPYELAPDDLIEEGLVVNLDWDERDSLWVQLDATITLDAPAAGSPLTVYAEGGPVVTLWGVDGREWTADWDVDLNDAERAQLLGKLTDLGDRLATRVDALVGDYLDAAAELGEDDRIETTDVAREWISGE